MDGYILIGWDIINNPDYDVSWIWENVGTEYAVEDDDGVWIKGFPDTNPADGYPDFLQTGAGGTITNSQNPIGG